MENFERLIGMRDENNEEIEGSVFDAFFFLGVMIFLPGLAELLINMM